MKIAVMSSSHHKRGTSALLADEFIRGACGARHTVFRFNATFEKVSPCIACDHCQRHSNVCVQKDAAQ